MSDFKLGGSPLPEEITNTIMRDFEERERARERRMAEDPEFRAAEEKRIAAAERHEQLERERKEREREASRVARLREIGVPELYIPKAFAWQSTPALEHAREFHDQKRLILVLAGPLGVGKTAALAWLVRKGPALLPRSFDFGTGRYEAWDDGPRFITAHRLARTDRYDDDAMAQLEAHELLALDDLGAELLDKVGAFVSLLDGLVNERYARRLRTAISTNLNLKQFSARYGERLVDRIREVGTFVELKGPSLRGRGA